MTAHRRDAPVPTRGSAQFLSTFVGRETELRAVHQHLRTHRLVTLSGAGGLGKTRLGYRVLDDLADEPGEGPGSVWSVDLADLHDPELLGYALATALGAPTPAEENAVSGLAHHIGARPATLFLDNCEHLREACAALVGALLIACPGLRILTSSRQPLGILGETVYVVPPLTLDDAVALFADRAAAALPSFHISTRDRADIAVLCMALDRMPLGIELAAVQIRAFSPQAIATRISAQGPFASTTGQRGTWRHGSLEACIDWSYGLCTRAEQLLWQRLSLFGGGFPLALVETACVGDGLGPDEVRPALAGLVDKSLVERELDDPEGRYRMLELIRQFGVAKLCQEGDPEPWRRAHRDFYLDLAEQFDAAWLGRDQKAWIERLRRETANLRLAFEFSVASPEEAPGAMRMASVLEHYFASHGAGPEAVRWLRLALAHDTGTPYERAFALRIGCFIAALNAMMDDADSMLAEIRQIADDTDDDRVRAFARYADSHVRTFQGDPQAGAAIAAEGVELLRRAGDVSREANLHFLRGMMLGWADRPDDAAEAYQQCLDLTEPRGERWLTSYSQWGLGVDAVRQGRLCDAIDRGRAALAAKADFGDQLGIGLTIELLAWTATEDHREREAAVLLGAAEALWDAIGTTIATMPILSRRRQVGIEATRETLGEESFDQLLARGRALSQADAIAIALGEVDVDRMAEKDELTRREREIADLVATGASNREIADRLVISVRTVESHVESILRKLGLRSRTQVATLVAARPTTRS